MSQKICSKCEVEKPLSDFSNQKNAKDGKQQWCKPCHTAAFKIFYKENKEVKYAKTQAWKKEHPDRVKHHRLKEAYGITLEDYDRMLKDQSGVCKICAKTPGKRALCVDHDHKTGAVRGLLCDQCNFALGHFNDNPVLLKNAIKYLTPSSSNTAAEQFNDLY